MFSAVRASPSESPTIAATAAASASIPSRPSPRSGSPSARRTIASRSASVRRSSTYTRQRERSAAITSNDGFSVVAPISVTVPRSTCGRKASCWALLKRWISSTKRIVRWPRRARRSSASATRPRTSLTPVSTAENGVKWALACAASREASVVFPVPGGPHRIIEWRSPDSIATRRRRPGPRRCACPTNSSRLRGRIRSASGAASRRLWRAVSSNSSTPPPGPLARSRSGLPRRSRSCGAASSTLSLRGQNATAVQADQAIARGKALPGGRPQPLRELTQVPQHRARRHASPGELGRIGAVGDEAGAARLGRRAVHP